MKKLRAKKKSMVQSKPRLRTKTYIMQLLANQKLQIFSDSKEVKISTSMKEEEEEEKEAAEAATEVELLKAKEEVVIKVKEEVAKARP